MTKKRNWRVFYTQARTEKLCERRLLERSIEVYLPKCTVVRQWKDRKKKVVEPLFNNYIFAHVNEDERLSVLQTSGIVRCVHFGGIPAVVDDDEIRQLQIAQTHPERLRLVDAPLPPPGEKVVITDGPLRGLTGEVEEHRGKYHVILRITAIKQAIRLNVPGAWLCQDQNAVA